MNTSEQNGHLSVALCQSDIPGTQAEENLAHFSDLLSAQTRRADIWILPETFATGFAVNDPQAAQKDGGVALEWMKERACDLGGAVTGSVLVREEDKIFNRLYFVLPDSSFLYYDKRHTFSYGGEGKFISRGSQRPTWEYKGWKIRPIICYDVRFPLWSRNDDNYDLLLCVANFPAGRISAWDTLLKARAIENICYVAGCNRTGCDAQGTAHNGHSMVITPTGQILAQAPEKLQRVIFTDISLGRVRSFRQKWGFLDDRDSFCLQDK